LEAGKLLRIFSEIFQKLIFTYQKIPGKISNLNSRKS